MRSRTARALEAAGAWARVLVVTSLVLSLLTTAWFAVRTIGVRVPYWGEAEVLYEASRIRQHLPLYVDPLVGTTDQGLGPPSRYYVTYPPLWSWVVSWLPSNLASVGSRLASTAAWFGSLAVLAHSARGERRLPALGAAAFVAGIWVLANFATIGRPDSVAIGIATIALVRIMRTGSVDALGVVLLVLVPWVKPTILGLPLGALVVGVLVARTNAARLRLILVVTIVAVASVGIAHVVSGGQLFTHVVRSNAQPFTLQAWLDQVPARLPFFAPLFVWAGWCGLRQREDPATQVLLGALVGSVAWTLVALAKTGSSSNYWMEPCIVSVALIAHAGYVRGPWPAILALVAVAWADVASIRAALEHAASERATAAVVGSLRERCGAPDDVVIAADEAGIELVVNGRILMPTYQMVHLVRRGSFPASPWIDELRSPATACFVEHTGQLRLAPELQRALEDAYAPIDRSAAGFTVWKKRP